MEEEEKKFEIMAPVGSYESLEAAIKAGTDSIYFGIEQLNMRARAANNFTTEDLQKIVKRCSEVNVRTYLTLNTILYDHDINLMKRIINSAKEAGISAIIASDLAAISYAHEVGVEIHISTQCNISNTETVKFYSKFADVVVLARELTLEQIKKICSDIKEEKIKGPKGELVKVEIFAHGALCVAISGKCHMSLATCNSSANRGACNQNCRRTYRVIDEDTKEELVIDNKYVMSPKDLCTIQFLDKLLGAGIYVLKLEGRGRAPDYVYTVVKAYKEAGNSVLEGTYTKEKIDNWMKELESVYNRGFWNGGYYMGKKLGEWSGTYGSQATKEKKRVGFCTNFYRKTNIGEFTLDSGDLKIGDDIIITGPTTGVLKQKLTSLYVNEKEEKEAKKGDVTTIKVDERVRPEDKLFVLFNRVKKEKV